VLRAIALTVQTRQPAAAPPAQLIRILGELEQKGKHVASLRGGASHAMSSEVAHADSHWQTLMDS